MKEYRWYFFSFFEVFFFQPNDLNNKDKHGVNLKVVDEIILYDHDIAVES